MNGTISDAAGAPFSDVAVRVMDHAGRTVGATRSDQGGRYSVNVPESGIYDLEFRAAGFRVRRIASIEIRPGEQRWIPKLTAVVGSPCEVPSERELILSSEKTMFLTGTVEDEDGSPFFGARLLIRSYKDLEYPIIVTTDKSGRYEFRGLAPGGYAILLETADYSTSFQIWVDPGFDVVIPNIRLEHCKTPGCKRVVRGACG
ncbi:MAG TPA: carboxypeptidase-like regulatory domain-containing protein [Bryobacteraceae bacterium]|nr:carboxypeptidase-like regulatory domain-containing protein [Bryobacteraceae bacterium]